jgi:hypothetical protein
VEDKEKEELILRVWNENVNNDLYEKWVEMRYIRDSRMEEDPKADEFFVVLSISDFFQQKQGMWGMAKKAAASEKKSEAFYKGLIGAYIAEYLNPETEQRIKNIGAREK